MNDDNLFLSKKEINERKIKENYKNFLRRKSSKHTSKMYNRHFKKK